MWLFFFLHVFWKEIEKDLGLKLLLLLIVNLTLLHLFFFLKISRFSQWKIIIKIFRKFFKVIN